jgi:putative peptidoglycan lipid II flippase
VLFGTGTSLEQVSSGEVLLLGLGATGAVGLHAAAQWLGAWRAGVVLRPRAGWRDPEVMEVIRRTLPSLGQAGLAALQLLVVLIAANRVPGGVVAFQLALNFYFLPMALGATPVALSLLPRLSRLDGDKDASLFRDILVRGVAFAFFLAIPAAVGYVTLAVPLAEAVSVGRMGSTFGVTMIAAALATLAPGLLGETAFLIMTYACYSRRDTRSPLRSMVVQVGTCLCLIAWALTLQGTALLAALGLAFSVGNLLGAWHLARQLQRTLRPGRERLAPSLARTAVSAALMAGPAWMAAAAARHVVDGWLGSLVGVLAATVLGGAVFLGSQALMHTPELAGVAGGLGYLRGKPRGRL